MLNIDPKRILSQIMHIFCKFSNMWEGTFRFNSNQEENKQMCWGKTKCKIVLDCRLLAKNCQLDLHSKWAWLHQHKFHKETATFISIWGSRVYTLVLLFTKCSNILTNLGKELLKHSRKHSKNLHPTLVLHLFALMALNNLHHFLIWTISWSVKWHFAGCFPLH